MAGRRFCSGCRGLCRVRVRLYLPADFLRPADSKPSGFRAPTQILATEAMQKRRPKHVASGRHRLPRRGGRATAAPRSQYRRAAVALPRRGQCQMSQSAAPQGLACRRTGYGPRLHRPDRLRRGPGPCRVCRRLQPQRPGPQSGPPLQVGPAAAAAMPQALIWG